MLALDARGDRRIEAVEVDVDWGGDECAGATGIVEPSAEPRR
jgi:hypothetical protein